MFLSFNAAIWLYPKPVDFRKQMDGLVMLVADHLQLNPTSGQLFLFRNRHANKIKMLWWENNGFWLCYKRLEKGKLKFPKINGLVHRFGHSCLRSQFNSLHSRPCWIWSAAE